MKHLKLIMCWGLWAVSALAAEPPAAGPATTASAPAAACSTPTDPAAEAFAWFDTLGYPKLAGLKMVKVSTGNMMGSIFAGDDDGAFALAALLIKDDGKRFTIFTTRLKNHTYTKSDPSVKGPERVDYKPIDMGKNATTVLTGLRGSSRPPNIWDSLGEKVSEQTEIFVLARACAANGLNTVARGLYDQAARMRDAETGEAPKDFRKYLRDDIATCLMWKAVTDFQDTSVSRAALLKQFQSVAAKFPKSRYAQRAKDSAAILEKMIAEDAQHARQPHVEPEKMTGQQRAAEMIYQLREQNDSQDDQADQPNAFLDRPGSGTTPAHQLVRLGPDAIGQLIDALGDERFTRTVVSRNAPGFTHHVLRVGDYAEAILSRIAGRNFSKQASLDKPMGKAGKVAEVREAVEEWWAEYKKKGEKHMLVEGTARGDDYSPAQAELLIKKYPDAAAEAVAQGVHNADSSQTRYRMIRRAGDLPSDKPVPLLLDILHNDPDCDCRIAAAEILLQRKRPEGVDAMIDLWNRPRSAGNPFPEFAEDSWRTGLARFLLDCGSPDAIRALAKDLASRPPWLKMDIVEAAARCKMFGIGAGFKKMPQVDLSVAAKIEEAVEDLLVAELADTDRREDMFGIWNGWDYEDPRLCDFAGCYLAERWPERYSFDPKTVSLSRDRQLIEMRNAWRKSRGKPLLPLPKPVVIEPPEPTLVDPMIQAVIETTDEAELAKIQANFDRLGLSALKPVQDRIARMKRRDPGRKRLVALASRLSNTVREIVVVKGSAEPTKPLRQALDAARGKPLTVETFARILATGIENMPDGAVEIELQAERSEEMTGMVILVKLSRTLNGRACKGEVDYSVGSTAEYIDVNNKYPFSDSGVGSASDYADPTREKFYKPAVKALRSPATRSVELRFLARFWSR